MMIRQGMMVKDLGTILVGKMAVEKELLMKLVVFLKLFWLHQEIEKEGRKEERKK